MPLTAEAKQSQKAAHDAAVKNAIEVATDKAEKAIQKILHRLEHDTMMSVETISVDTRNFGQLATEIYLTHKQRA